MIKSKIHLKSGEIYYARTGELFVTTLGSCVAFCLYDPNQHVGGMAHFLLPDKSLCSVGDSTAQNELNFGSVAIPKLLGLYKQQSGRPENLEVSIFGGCLRGTKTKMGTRIEMVSLANVECALSLISKFGLHLKAQKTGLDNSLSLSFNTGTGEITTS